MRPQSPYNGTNLSLGWRTGGRPRNRTINGAIQAINRRLKRPDELESDGRLADIEYMIDRGIQTDKRSKSLGSESVHGLPLNWQEQPRKGAPKFQRRREALLATQNVHGLPTIWDELDLSE